MRTSLLATLDVHSLKYLATLCLAFIRTTLATGMLHSGGSDQRSATATAPKL